jgi:ribulose bisphosphate carboxylase small subunit
MRFASVQEANDCLNDYPIEYIVEDLERKDEMQTAKSVLNPPQRLQTEKEQSQDNTRPGR